MGNHTADIVADNVDFVFDPDVFGNKGMQILCHGKFIIAISGSRTFSCAAVVGCDDLVSSICERGNDMAELIGGLREPVNEKNCSFEFLTRWRWTGKIMYGDFCRCRWLSRQELALGGPAGGVKSACCHGSWFLVLCVVSNDDSGVVVLKGRAVDSLYLLSVVLLATCRL